MFCDPMNATSPSTTTSLRWLRRSGRRQRPLSGWIGIIWCHSMPARVIRSFIRRNPGYLREPMWSYNSRTVTPRWTASTRAVKNGSVVSSQATM